MQTCCIYHFTSHKLTIYMTSIVLIIMVEFEQIIKTRRSIREYSNRDVSDDDVRYIVDTIKNAIA